MTNFAFDDNSTNNSKYSSSINTNAASSLWSNNNQNLNTSSLATYDNATQSVVEEIDLSNMDNDYTTSGSYSYEGVLKSGVVLGELRVEEIIRIADELKSRLESLKKEYQRYNDVDSNVRMALSYIDPPLDENSPEYKEAYENYIKEHYPDDQQFTFDEIQNKLSEISKEIKDINEDLDVIFKNTDEYSDEENACNLIKECLDIENRLYEYERILEEHGDIAEINSQVKEDALAWYNGEDLSEEEIVQKYLEYMEETDRFEDLYDIDLYSYEAGVYFLENEEMLNAYLDEIKYFIESITGKTYEEIKEEHYIQNDFVDGTYYEGKEDYVEYGLGDSSYYIDDKESLNKYVLVLRQRLNDALRELDIIDKKDKTLRYFPLDSVREETIKKDVNSLSDEDFVDRYGYSKEEIESLMTMNASQINDALNKLKTDYDEYNSIRKDALNKIEHHDSLEYIYDQDFIDYYERFMRTRSSEEQTQYELAGFDEASSKEIIYYLYLVKIGEEDKAEAYKKYMEDLSNRRTARKNVKKRIDKMDRFEGDRESFVSEFYNVLLERGVNDDFAREFLRYGDVFTPDQYRANYENLRDMEKAIWPTPDEYEAFYREANVNARIEVIYKEIEKYLTDSEKNLFMSYVSGLKDGSIDAVEGLQKLIDSVINGRGEKSIQDYEEEYFLSYLADHSLFLDEVYSKGKEHGKQITNAVLKRVFGTLGPEAAAMLTKITGLLNTVGNKVNSTSLADNEMNVCLIYAALSTGNAEVVSNLFKKLNISTDNYVIDKILSEIKGKGKSATLQATEDVIRGLVFA